MCHSQDMRSRFSISVLGEPRQVHNGVSFTLPNFEGRFMDFLV